MKKLRMDRVRAVATLCEDVVSSDDFIEDHLDSGASLSLSLNAKFGGLRGEPFRSWITTDAEVRAGLALALKRKGKR